MFQRVITKPGSWLHAHPWTLVAFLGGLTLGIAVAKLIADLPSPDAVASVVGAAIGSGLAVFGAVWVSDLSERRQRNLLLSTLKELTAPTVEKVQELLEYLRSPERHNDLVLDKLRWTRSLIHTSQVTLGGMQPLFAHKVSEHLAHWLVTKSYATLLAKVDELIVDAHQPANRMYTWARTDFSALEDANKSLRDNTRFVL